MMLLYLFTYYRVCCDVREKQIIPMAMVRYGHIITRPTPAVAAGGTLRRWSSDSIRSQPRAHVQHGLHTLHTVRITYLKAMQGDVVDKWQEYDRCR
jgi:hypothetical protein